MPRPWRSADGIIATDCVLVVEREMTKESTHPNHPATAAARRARYVNESARAN
jgi:hypothetical protein